MKSVILFCFLLSVLCAILASMLTGGKALQDFAPNDWTVCATMAGPGAVLAAAFCILLCRYLRDTEKLDTTQNSLCLAILQTAPVGPGNVIKLLIGYEAYTPIRLTV